jgi:hypothetical protein
MGADLVAELCQHPQIKAVFLLVTRKYVH